MMAVMKTSQIDLIVSTEIQDYHVLFEEIDFGDPEMFQRVMTAWCLNMPSPTLTLWEVYLGVFENQIIGTTGLYRLLDTPDSMIRLGWTGIRRRFERQGLGKALLSKMQERARTLGYRELVVHTEGDHENAIRFYESAGFEKLGLGSTLPACLSYDPTDMVLRCNLSKD